MTFRMAGKSKTQAQQVLRATTSRAAQDQPYKLSEAWRHSEHSRKKRSSRQCHQPPVSPAAHTFGDPNLTQTHRRDPCGQGTSNASGVCEELLSDLTYGKDFWLANGDHKLYSKWSGSISPEAGSHHHHRLQVLQDCDQLGSVPHSIQRR